MGMETPVAVVTAGLVFNYTLARAPQEEHSRASLSGFWSLIDDLTFPRKSGHRVMRILPLPVRG